MYYNNGDIYEGDWKNDEKEGKGTEYYNRDDQFKGDKYVGDWKNCKKDIIIITEIDMKVNIKMENQKVKQYIIIIIVIYM